MEEAVFEKFIPKIGRRGDEYCGIRVTKTGLFISKSVGIQYGERYDILYDKTNKRIKLVRDGKTKVSKSGERGFIMAAKGLSELMPRGRYLLKDKDELIFIMNL